MKVEIEAVNWNKDKEQMSPLLNELPKWRLEKALSFHFDVDKYLCAKSFFLLKKMLLQEYQLKDIPQFSYGENGKPYFKEYPNIHFNISHCKTGIACVVNNTPVGIDIEQIHFDKIVAENILSQKELQIVQNSKFPEQEFIKYWTMKESYLKLIRVGITDDMKNILDKCADEVEFKTYVDNTNSFVTTVAFNKNKE